MISIFKCEFGSSVYGTRVPTSDYDYKEVFIPESKLILLQKAPKTIVQSTKIDKKSRNTKDDIDTEMFAVHQFLELLMQGQTVALDMIFTPRNLWQHHDETWLIIKENRHHFLHKGTSSFVGYARQQASKYGIKGSRIAAVRTTLDFLKQYNPEDKLKDSHIIDNLNDFVYTNDGMSGLKNEYINFITINNPKHVPELHLEVCGRKIAIHVKVKYVVDILQRIFDQYGERALLAEKNESVDWKALMHAVRVNYQAIELFKTHNITFPRPEADLLLKIRKGEFPYKQVAEIIELGLEEIEQAAKNTTLPEIPNREKANDLIVNIYGKQILENLYD